MCSKILSNGLAQADVDLLQTIANQVAVAVRNTRSGTRAQPQDERQSRIASIGQKIRETTTVENALQVAERELGRALDSKQIRDSVIGLSASRPDGNGIPTGRRQIKIMCAADRRRGLECRM